jgi:hypothetical protein
MQLKTMSQRPAIVRPQSSRAFTDSALAELARGGWSPGAWLRFLFACGRRSGEQAILHPRASLELGLLGAGLGLTGHRLAALLTWSMGVTHLGLLGEDDSFLGWPNRISLLRANLPALMPSSRAAAPLALASDYLDGQIARRGRETAFGAYADGLADIVFWSWFLWKNEPARWLRAVAVALWTLPATAITVAYFKQGRTLDYPRPRWFRQLSVGCQLLVAARAWRRRSQPFRSDRSIQMSAATSMGVI